MNERFKEMSYIPFDVLNKKFQEKYKHLKPKKEIFFPTPVFDLIKEYAGIGDRTYDENLGEEIFMDWESFENSFEDILSKKTMKQIYKKQGGDDGEYTIIYYPNKHTKDYNYIIDYGIGVMESDDIPWSLKRKINDHLNYREDGGEKIPAHWYADNYRLKMIDKYRQKGSGVFLREAGKFPPDDRKLIEQVGEEKVEKLTLFRYPISLSKFAKFIGALKNTPYDDLIHIGVVINGKYLTEKDAVLNFERAGVPSQSTDTLDVALGTKSITINDLLENTRKRMGDQRFTEYRALSWNCQDYLQNMLEANGVSTAETTKFIKQDLEQVVKNLPSFANAIANFFTGAKAVVNRLTKGEGDDCQCGGATNEQRGEAAMLREYVYPDKTYRNSGIAGVDYNLKNELNSIIHSADPYYNYMGAPAQTWNTNYFKDYTNTFDPEAQKVIDSARYYLSNLKLEESKPENTIPYGRNIKTDTKLRNRYNNYKQPPFVASPYFGTASTLGPAIGGTASIITTPPTASGKTALKYTGKTFTPSPSR